MTRGFARVLSQAIQDSVQTGGSFCGVYLKVYMYDGIGCRPQLGGTTKSSYLEIFFPRTCPPPQNPGPRDKGDTKQSPPAPSPAVSPVRWCGDVWIGAKQADQRGLGLSAPTTKTMYDTEPLLRQTCFRPFKPTDLFPLVHHERHECQGCAEGQSVHEFFCQRPVF